jgi:L-fucose mutarotase/ribose pyranase (RbsD/FucU family)
MLYKRKTFTVPAVSKRRDPALCAKGHTMLKGACVHCEKTAEEIQSIESSQLSRSVLELTPPATKVSVDEIMTAVATMPDYIELFEGKHDGAIVRSVDAAPAVQLHGGDRTWDGRTWAVVIAGETALYEYVGSVKGIAHMRSAE